MTALLLRRFVLLCLTVGLVAVLLPSSVDATEQTGKLRGRVTESSGLGLDGATVRVTSASLQGIRSTRSGADGSFFLPSLPPGLYDIRVEYEGYQAWLKQGVRILIGSSLTLEVELSTAEVSETVTVVDDRPVIDTTTSTTGSVVTREAIKALPISRSYQGATKNAPGVTGGSNPNALGGSSRENKWLLDGANTTDPVTGTFSFNFNLDAIEEIEVITGAFRAENGGSLGAIINVRTRSGSNRLEGGVSGYYSNGNWSPKRDATFTPDGRGIEGSEFDRESQGLNLGAFLGGALVKDKVWFFSSLLYIRNASTSGGARSPRLFEGYNFFTKVTASPHPKHQLILSVHNGPANISNVRQSYLVDPAAQRHQYQNSLVIGGEWKWFLANNVHTRLHYTHMKTDIDVTPQPCTWRDDDRFKQCQDQQPEGYIDFLTPGRIGILGSRSTENNWYYSLNDRWRDAVRATATAYLVSPIGTHEVKGGVELEWLQADNTFAYTGNLYYVDRLEDASDSSSTINYYWRETQGQLYQRNRGSTQFVFLQDTWEPVAGLTIDLGVKYDRAVMRNDVGEKIVGFDMVSPVGGVSWDPTGRQIAKIYAGGGVVIDESRLSIASFLDKNGLGRKLYLGPYFSGRSTNYSFDQYSIDRGQSNYEKFADLTTPRVYNIVAGFEVQPGDRTSVGMTASAKLFRHLWEDDEVNYIWNGGGTNTVGVINGQQDYFFRLRTPSAATRNWFGLTFYVKRQMFKNLLLDINYTMSMTRGLTATQITAALDNATQRPYEYGWLYSDRPHVVKASAAYRLPIGLVVAGTFNFTSGSRFDREYYAEKGGYANYVAERGTFDSVNPWWSLDLKLSYDLQLPAGKWFASIELNNVTNNRQATGISSGALNSGGEYFASGRQSPMSLEIGLGYEF
ncbi:MAG: carboxypeptidase regulatory-like domain-containing protein [Myxococcota bacterium]|nr:carboxypeptidase regulatory-like domain-containing protein [Myxococcota bacterium]